MTSAGRPLSGVNGRPPELSVSVPAVAEQLATLRRTVRSFLQEHGAAADVVDDLELAVSELTTNVIRHTEAPTIGLAVARSNGAWVVDVADAEQAPDPAEACLPSPDDPTGRGLFVVASVMDRVDIVDVDGGQVIRCTRVDPR